MTNDNFNPFDTLVKNSPSSMTQTWNGDPTYISSDNACVDLFYKIGSARGQFETILPLLEKSFTKCSLTTVKILLWLRDVRGGAGERELFRKSLKFIESKNPEIASLLMPKIPEVGRWDDLLAYQNPELRKKAMEMYMQGLRNPETSGLAAKWANVKDKKGFRALREYAGMTERQWRKFIVPLRQNIVERKMSAKEWAAIDYNQVPSLASIRYSKAFTKRDENRYKEYVESLTDPNAETKVNAGAVYPYDICKPLTRGADETTSKLADAQWAALPDYLEGSNEKILPMVDVSGSMMCSVGDNPNLTCIDVAVSLGMYTASRNNSMFKDMYMTFTSVPTLLKMDSNSSLQSNLYDVRSAPWGMSTNIDAAFETLVNHAIENDIPQDQMPTTILIFSDMQFDHGTTTRTTDPIYGSNGRRSTFERVRKSEQPAIFNKRVKDLYESNGYTKPKIVYWNLNASGRGTPVKTHETGAALVSGFSPSLMKAVFSGNLEQFSPASVMAETIGVERYAL